MSPIIKMNIPEKVIDSAAEYSGHIRGYEAILLVLDNHFNRNIESVVEAIKVGPECIHYGLLMYLRFDCGVEAWGESTPDKNSMVYKFRSNKDSDYTYIYPLNRRNLKAEYLAMGLNEDGSIISK